MTIREFLGVLSTRWKTIIAITLLVVAAAAAVTLRTQPTYEATARIFLSTDAPTKPDESRGTVVLTAGDLNTYVEVMGTQAVLEPLRARLGVPASTPLAVSGQVSDKAALLDVTVTAQNAQLAADAANALGPTLAEVARKFSPLLASTGQQVVSTTIMPAVTPGSPTSPDVRRNLGLGVLAGLLLGLGVALVRHVLDTKVRDESDVTTLSDRPILAHIPFDKNARNQPLALVTDPHGLRSEAVRRLRTNLMFVDVTTGRHTFVITSAMAEEGKTTTAINLALAMADAGARVLLIDCDLRNPSVARTMDLDGSVGLTTVLLGRVKAADAIQEWPDSSLHVLPAGQTPPNPSELLGSAPMQALFGELAADYDFVLIDSPPVVPVVDAVILNRLAGGLLLVVAADRTRKRELASALRSLATVEAGVAGFALNMSASDRSTAYRYGYHQYVSDQPSTGRRLRLGRRKG